jgi:hypothetical protein
MSSAMLNSKCIVAFSFSLILSLASFYCQAQENRVLYSSAEIKQEPAPPKIKSIRSASAFPFITVVYENGSKKKIDNKDVWGFILDGRLYRRYKRDFLEVVNQGELIEYKSRPIPDYDVTTNSTNMIERPHVFSKTLDGKLYPSAKAASKGD